MQLKSPPTLSLAALERQYGRGREVLSSELAAEYETPSPSIVGVVDATLNRFCLTRPFPGPAEADHIQEL